MLMFVVGSTRVPAADQTTEIQKAAILNTITEAPLAAVSLIQDRSPAKQRISWSGSYSEPDWVFTLDVLRSRLMCLALFPMRQDAS